MSLGVLVEKVTGRLRPLFSSAEHAPEAKAEGQQTIPLPVKQVVLTAAAMWLITRTLLLALTGLASAFGLLLPNSQDFPVPQADLLAHPFLSNWLHWDGVWYVDIATRGYGYSPLNLTGWFPMYPLQIRAVSLLLGEHQSVLAAMLAANLATLGAFIGLGLLAVQEMRDEQAAGHLIRVVAAFPFAYFLFAPYTEGFFLLCIAFCFLFARRGSWWWAVLFAFLSGLTRPTSVALILPLAWEFARQHGVFERMRWRASAWREWLRPRVLLPGLAVIGAVPLAIGCYMLYLQVQFGNPFLYLQSQLQLHGHVNWPIWKTAGVLLERLIKPGGATPYRDLLLYIDAGTFISFLVITLAYLRRMPFTYSLYVLSTLYLMASTPFPGQIELITSPGRYLLMAIPVFLIFARWIERRPWLDLLLVGGGVMLQAVFALFWLRGGFIE